MGIALTRFAFTTAMRMVDRIHDDPAYVRATAQPSVASCFADSDVLVVQIADLADRRHA